MSQFGSGKPPPPWQQQRSQPAGIQTSLLGQHPAAAPTPAGLPTQQLVIGGAPQQPQYAPVQQSMIQPPGLGGLQTLAQSTLPQVQTTMAQPTLAQPNVVQVTMGAANNPASLMGQPPLTSQTIQPPTIVNPTQLASSQIPQIQPQVTTVSYPTPRALAPPVSFNPPTAQGNIGNNNINNNGNSQQPQKQRVFTGVITKLCADFGFVDEDVFFQTSCVKDQPPKVGDRVVVEASFNPTMPFKWNANQVQVIPGVTPTSGPVQNNQRSGQSPREPGGRPGSYNAVPPPNFSGDNQSSGFSSGRSAPNPRARSPRRDRREDSRNHPRERERDREDKEKDNKRESRKRSRSRDRSRSPPRRRQRVVPRYNVQVPKILLHVKEVNVLELRKRYSNLYVPSDVFLSRPLWSDTFPAHRPFTFPRPVAFHIMSKEVDAVLENDAVYDPPDVNYSYAAKVMLMAVPALEDLYRRSCALSEDPSDVRDCFVHPTRLINFLVGLKGKNETMAIGGYWSPSLDGANPEKDPNVLIKTAIRTCMALTGINLSGCTTWYRFAEIYYRRGESTHKGRSSPARVETTVIFLPDVWNICPTKLEWDGLHLNYKRQLEKKLSSSSGSTSQSHNPQGLEDTEEEEGIVDDKEGGRKDPSHWSLLDPRNMKVIDLRCELDARLVNSKGLKSQLIARLTKVIKGEQEKEELEKNIKAEKMECDEIRKKEDEEKRREEEKKRREEEEKKKEEEEKKKAEERERNLLEKRYTLPEQPMIAVHPSRTAKSGKFDCTTMSLSVLLDYRQEDNKEHSFEVSLFAEMFNEMLMRDFAFRIYRALFEFPEKPKDEKKDKERKDDNKRDERDDKGEEKRDRKDDDDRDDKDDDKSGKKRKTNKDSKDDDDDENLIYDFYEDDDEDSKDGRADRDRKRESSKKDKNDSKKEKKEKKKMCTIDPHLLLSFVYFDQTHTGYIIDKDLEDIINMLSLNLSRAQLKRLLIKVMSRDVLYYRKLTDVPLEDRDKNKDTSQNSEIEVLAKGNNMLLPSFFEISDGAMKNESKKIQHPSKDDSTNGDCLGVIKHEGSLVDISKLMQQLERSEKARSDTEDKLREFQKELNTSKDEARRESDKSSKLSKEIRNLQSNVKSLEEELKKAVEDNSIYQKALSTVNNVVKPLVAGTDLDDDDSSKSTLVHIKQERPDSHFNGT